MCHILRNRETVVLQAEEKQKADHDCQEFEKMESDNVAFFQYNVDTFREPLLMLNHLYEQWHPPEDKAEKCDQVPPENSVQDSF